VESAAAVGAAAIAAAATPAATIGVTNFSLLCMDALFRWLPQK
jgi:hypothetical protein